MTHDSVTRDDALVARYRIAQRIPADVPIAAEQVRRHWALERELTTRLMASTEDDRWEVFEHAYTTLYSELDWLQEGGERLDPRLEGIRLAEFAALIGSQPQDVYEVGSGQGALLLHLSSRGHRCKGTEITRERGHGVGGIAWGHSDGVHLDRFERPGSYDVVISSQVVEHLHPDDLVSHFTGARKILRPGGRYILDTPHRLHGPADVSDVFGCEYAQGMHLKEYTFGEIREAAQAAGFTEVKAVFRLPLRAQARLPIRPRPHSSSAHLSYLEFLERALARVPGHSRRRRVSRLAALVGFQTIFVELRRS